MLSESKHCTINHEISRIGEEALFISAEENRAFVNAARREREITELIIKLGIPANMKGYRYLKKALMLALDNEALLDSVTKRLYPEVARECSVTSAQVERSIRNAVAYAWNHGCTDTEYVEGKLHCRISDSSRPTNCQLIALICDSLRQFWGL